jgi:hypothetical protein
MALRTLGSNATTSLSAFVVGFNDTIPADVGTLITQMREDPSGYRGPEAEVAASGLVTGQGTVRSRVNQGYVQQGQLIIPGRGQLWLRPGDFICWDATTGWPFVLSGDAAANGPYTHT